MKQYRLSVNVHRLCMSPLTPLDGSIAAMIAQNTLPVLDMFQMQSGIPMASYPIFKSRHTTDHSVLRSLERHWTMAGVPDAVERTDHKLVTVLGSKSVSYHRGSVNRVYHPEGAQVDYYFTGDGDTVLSLLNRFRAIGAWTGKGYGTLEQDHDGAVAYLFPVDMPLCGFADEENRLIRPLPLKMATRLKIDPDSYHEYIGRASIPYAPVLARRFGYRNEPIALPKTAFRDD